MSQRRESERGKDLEDAGESKEGKKNERDSRGDSGTKTTDIGMPINTQERGREREAMRKGIEEERAGGEG